MVTQPQDMQISLRPPEGTSIPLAVFGNAVVRANSMLETFEIELGLTYPEPGFELKSLHSSNPTITVTGKGHADKREVYASVIDAMSSASTGNWSSWPQSSRTFECVDAIRDFVTVGTNVGADSIFVLNGRKEMGTESSIDNLTRWSSDLESETTATPALGVVSGQLGSISVRSRNVFAVWRSRDNLRFECEFNDELFEDARRLLRKIVAVYGLVDEGRTGQNPRKVTNITKIREVVPNEPGNTLEFYGSIPDLKGNLSDDEYWEIVRKDRIHYDE